MALRWNAKDKMGVLTIKQNGQKFRVGIYSCNALAAFIYTYKDAEGKEMCSLYSFFADEKHCKNMIRDFGSLFGDEVVSAKLNIAYKDAEKVAHIMAKAGYKVTIYCKEVKK